MHLPKFGRFPLASQPYAQIWGEHESALLVTLRVQLRPEESKMIFKNLYLIGFQKPVKCLVHPSPAAPSNRPCSGSGKGREGPMSRRVLSLCYTFYMYVSTSGFCYLHPHKACCSLCCTNVCSYICMYDMWACREVYVCMHIYIYANIHLRLPLHL